MHEDIDDYEPDFSAYYSMDENQKQLLRELGYWQKKHYSGKISYGKYIEGLKDFREILTIREWKEIEEYEKELLAEKEIKSQKEANLKFHKQKEREESNKKLGCIFAIIMLIVMIMGALSSRW